MNYEIVKDTFFHLFIFKPRKSTFLENKASKLPPIDLNLFELQ
jgi:hypothetical protein